jgi:hypothetical protein
MRLQYIHHEKKLPVLLFYRIKFIALAQIEPATYFNIYVPPNNEVVQDNVALIITAVSDSTSFSFWTMICSATVKVMLVEC